MTRLPGYRRGSFVLHLIASAILLLGGMLAAGAGSDVRVARASTPAHPVAPSLAKLDTIIPGSRTFLGLNYPNPVRQTTTIFFSVARTMIVTIRVYDYLYNQVELLVNNEQFDAGEHRVLFDTKSNGIVFSGMYIYEMRADNEVFRRRMMVIK